MSDLLVKKLSSATFDAEKYVHEVSLSGDSYADLQATRGTIQNLADETNTQMKKNVYKNYAQFIETAKEISYLESEMYQLSHMLNEQKSVMSALLDISVSEDKGILEIDGKKKDEEDSKKNLTSLLEIVEGCARIMDVPGRYLIQSGPLIELDTQSFAHTENIHMFLLNDSVVMTTALPATRRGPVAYKFQVLYELDNVAIVNTRDTSSLKNGIKILMFPHTRIFQCPDSSSKKLWLTNFEKTKTSRSQADIEKRFGSDTNPYVERLNPFAEDDLDSKQYNNDEHENPEWLIELPDDLDVCIAERDFENATALIDKAQSHFKEFPESTSLTEIKVSVDNRVKHLTQVLMNELRVTQDKSLQGGPRAVRRAVSLLIKLGKSIQACELFLKHRSAVLKHQVKQLKIEGSTVMYVKRMSSVFFSFLSDTGREFLRAFPKNNNCCSAFVVWSQAELKAFTNALSIQVFTSSASLSNIAECISIARNSCDQLKNIGLDLTFDFDAQITPQIEKVILDARDKMLEAIRLRAQEEKWRPINFQNKAGVVKFLDDMVDIGIASIHTYIYDDCWVGLTNNSVHFSKAYLNFVEDLLKLMRQDLATVIDNCLVETFEAQLAHIDASLSNPLYKNEVKFIQNNSRYLLDTLLNLAEHKYAESTKSSCAALSALRTHAAKTPGTTSKTKYSSTGYL